MLKTPIAECDVAARCSRLASSRQMGGPASDKHRATWACDPCCAPAFLKFLLQADINHELNMRLNSSTEYLVLKWFCQNCPEMARLVVGSDSSENLYSARSIWWTATSKSSLRFSKSSVRFGWMRYQAIDSIVPGTRCTWPLRDPRTRPSTSRTKRPTALIGEILSIHQT